MHPLRRICLMIVVAGFAAALVGCGSDSSSSTTSSETVRAAADFEAETGWTIDAPEGPPPEELVIKELRKGTGATARKGDEVEVQYVDALYSSGEVISIAEPYAPLHLHLGAEGGLKGWEKGVVGMKVGGRRELLVPATVVPGEGREPATFVLVELVGVA